MHTRKKMKLSKTERMLQRARNYLLEFVNDGVFLAAILFIGSVWYFVWR